jgi:hypothetical protein
MALASDQAGVWGFSYDFDFFDLFNLFNNSDFLNDVLRAFLSTGTLRAVLLEALTAILFSAIVIALCRYYLLFSVNSAKATFNTILEGLNWWFKSIVASLYYYVRLLPWMLLSFAALALEGLISYKLNSTRYFWVIAPFIFSLTGIFFSVFITYKALSYSQLFFVLSEYPSIPLGKALKTSIAITKGACVKLFLLGLSFIGWAFLCIFTAGIGFLFLVPYMSVSYANAYRTLKTRAFEAGILVKKTAQKKNSETEETHEQGE